MADRGDQDKPPTGKPTSVGVDISDELLANFLMRRLQLERKEKESQPPQALEDLSLHGIAKLMQTIQSSEDKCKVIVMTGAGISTAAGIPDFRSPDTGLYANLQKYNLPYPQAIFEIDYFRQNPKPFYALAQELYPTNFKPTLSHYFIRLLAEKGLLLRNYTQNIDTLERRAGLNPDLLVEAHGGFHTAHCVDCGHEYSQEFVKDIVFKGQVPRCTQDSCRETPAEAEEKAKEQEEGEGEKDRPMRGLVKPDIVFFGEALPKRFAQCAKEDMKKSDLLLIMGTSLLVHPFASLVDKVRPDCPRLLINREKVGQGNPLMALLGLGVRGGLDFNEETGYRDVFHEASCDDGCRKLATLLGWEKELEELYASEHAKLDQQQAEKKEGEGEGSGKEPAPPEAAL